MYIILHNNSYWLNLKISDIFVSSRSYQLKKVQAVGCTFIGLFSISYFVLFHVLDMCIVFTSHVKTEMCTVSSELKEH